MKMDTRRTLQLILVIVILLGAALIVSKCQSTVSSAAITPSSDSQMSTSPRVAKLFGASIAGIWDIIKSHKGQVTKIVNIFFALFIGFAGAMAFYVGVYFGFIAKESRKDITQYIGTRGSATLFAVFGGVVAGVFQWAQGETLAPIQAFVLGATWPSVVTSIMPSSTTAPPKPTPTDVVRGSTPVSGQPSQAEVVIPAPSKTTPADVISDGTPASGQPGQAEVVIPAPSKPTESSS